MRLYLIRHAPAFEQDGRRWPDDRLRPLTPEGVKRFRKAAAGLEQLAERAACVLTSPLVRARQTADILTAVARWPRAQELAQLAPGHAPEVLLAVLRAQAVDSLALVGHEPGLSQLLVACIAGTGAHIDCGLKKGGAACLTFSAAVRAGRARLDWLITPKALRALA
jgi:phosphohistidine phosphatase